MRMFVVVLALASATVAEIAQIVSLYGAWHIQHKLPNDALGIIGLMRYPVTVAFKIPGKDEIGAYSISGIGSIYGVNELKNFRDNFILGEEKVALFLSAAEVLNISEIHMPIRQVILSKGDTLDSTFNALKRWPGHEQWVFLTEKKSIPDAALKQLKKYGELSFTSDKVSINRDFAHRVRVRKPFPQPQSALPPPRLPLPRPVLVLARKPLALEPHPAVERLFLRGEAAEADIQHHQTSPAPLPTLRGDFSDLARLPGDLSELAELSELSELS